MDASCKHHMTALMLVLGTSACGQAIETAPVSAPQTGVVDGKADRFEDAPELELLFEVELEDVLEHPDTSRFEASGVTIADDRIIVVFDNLRRFASFDMGLDDFEWLGDADGYGVEDDDRVEDDDDFQGFEGVTVDPATGGLELAIEAMETDDGDDLPVIVHWTPEQSRLEWIDVEVEALNKGVEGLAHLEVDGQCWRAALCETGKCDGRHRGRLILTDEDGDLDHVDLPKGLGFDDFSGLAIDGDRLAVVSQESSRIWIGQAVFDDDDEFVLETERVVNLPRQDDGDVDFCTVEGLAWLDPETLVAVSDLEKDGQHKRCEDHAERIHFFDVPVSRTAP